MSKICLGDTGITGSVGTLAWRVVLALACLLSAGLAGAFFLCLYPLNPSREGGSEPSCAALHCCSTRVFHQSRAKLALWPPPLLRNRSAPEVLWGQKCTAKADVYGFGIGAEGKLCIALFQDVWGAQMLA